MIIFIYPERKDATIGRFDEPDVETCALVLGSYKDLHLIKQGFKFCDKIMNPIRFLPDFDEKICNIVSSDGKPSKKTDGVHMGIRICRNGLLALASEKAERAEDYIRADIANMAITANELMGAEGSRRMNTYCPDDILSVVGSLAEAFDLVMNQRIPLRDRYSILEDGVDDDLPIFEKVIKAIVDGYAEKDD